MASAGGTTSAFIVTTAEPVADELLTALMAVRDEANRCVYSLAWQGSQPSESAQVQVGFTLASGEAITVELRTDRDECDPEFGGFYFDATSSNASDVVRIVLCPSTCEQLAYEGQPVDLLVSCE